MDTRWRFLNSFIAVLLAVSGGSSLAHSGVTMASERRGRANRENARKSTGPRSRAGRRHSSRNARKHGLNVPLWPRPEVGDFVEKLADEIAGAQSTQETRRAARAAAEAY